MSFISRMLINEGQQALRTTAVLLLVCGLGFPLVLTGLGNLLFYHQAQGSPVEADGVIVGCEHIGQEFTAPCYLHPRPSAYHYNTYYEREDGTQYYNDDTEFGGIASGGFNYAPSNPDLTSRVKEDVETFLNDNPNADPRTLPSELFTASGSGMDPHISPDAALVQVPRIAEASGLTQQDVTQLIDEHTEHKAFGIFGEEAVNVLGVNVAIHQEMSQENHS